MLEAELLKKIRAIEIRSRKILRAGLIGQYKSAFRGSGMMFKEFRLYEYGDDVRHISWNVSARMPSPVVKVFEEERERQLFLLVDVSGSVRKGPWARLKAERLAELTGILALSAAEAGDELGLLLFSDRIEKMIPPAKGRAHLLRLIRDVLIFEPQSLGTSIELPLRQLESSLKKRSIVILLSDLERLPSPHLLRRTSKQHDFFVIGVENPREFDFQETGFFFEMLTAESLRPVTIDASSPSFHRFLKAQGENRRIQIQEHFKKSGIELLWSQTNLDPHPILEAYFSRRIQHHGTRG